MIPASVTSINATSAGVTLPAAPGRAKLIEGHAEVEQQYIRSITGATVNSPHWIMYRYTKPAVILGRSQRPDEEQMSRAARQGVTVIRRRSGGGAVMAGPEMLSLTAIFPPRHAISTSSSVAAYNWMGRFWQKILLEHGIECHLPNPGEARRSQQLATARKTDWACYSSVSHGELLTPDGRKLLGVAQIRTRHCTALTSGIYLYPPDWSVLSQVVTNRLSHALTLRKYNASIHCLAGSAVTEFADTIVRQINRHLFDQLNDPQVGRSENTRGNQYEYH